MTLKTSELRRRNKLPWSDYNRRVVCKQVESANELMVVQVLVLVLVLVRGDDGGGSSRKWPLFFCGFARGLCVFVVFVLRVYQTPAPIMPLLQQPCRGLRSVALILFNANAVR